MKKPLPVGVDNFERIITEDYYYVDKIIYVFLTIFLYLLKCPQSLIL